MGWRTIVFVGTENTGKPLKEIRLGTAAASVTENNHTFTLQDATVTTVTIMVVKKDSDNTQK